MLTGRISSFRFPKTIHTTWAKTFQCRVEAFFQPSALSDIVELVKAARSQSKTLLVVGSGHSPSDMAMTSEWLVNLDRFSRVLSLTPHEGFTDVKVEAGIRIFELNKFLKDKGLALQNLGSISEQSMAGIISTGTHGSSCFHGLVSEQIVDLTVVNGKGEVETCSEAQNPDLFRAAMLSLGKVGIITHATIRTVPSFKLKARQQVISLETLISEWGTLWSSSEFIRVWWFPYSRHCILWRADKSEEAETEPMHSWYGTKFGRWFYESLLWVCVNVFPRLTPAVEKFVFSRQYGMVEADHSSYIQPSAAALNMDCLFKQYVNEWALPLTNGPAVIQELDGMLQNAAAQGEYYSHAPIEVRYSNSNLKSSEKGVRGNLCRPFLDTTHRADLSESIDNSQLTLYLNATMYRPFGSEVPIGQWYRDFERVVGDAGGKPHWAKNFIGSKELAGGAVKRVYKDNEMVGFAGYMDRWYGKDFLKFKEIMQLQDPDGVFLSGRSWAVRNGFVNEKS